MIGSRLHVARVWTLSCLRFFGVAKPSHGLLFFSTSFFLFTAPTLRSMSNPWRETKGYSFHSICLHVKDIEESSMFYQHVFGMCHFDSCSWTGMNLIREANVG